MQIVKKLFENKFVRNVSLLMSGTAFAHIISFIMLPILTRVYSPSEYGIMGLFSSILIIITSVSSLKYELAIPLPKNELAANSVILLSFIVLAFVSTVLFLFFYFLPSSILLLSPFKELGSLIWLLPIGVFVSGSYVIFQYVSTRQKNFKNMAVSQTGQSAIMALTQYLSGIFNFGAFGLVIGKIIGDFAGSLNLSLVMRNRNFHIRLRHLKCVAKKYKNFPKYSAFETLANNLGIQFPIVLLAFIMSGSRFGCLVLAIKILQVPMGLIGRSISQVYFSQAVEKYRNGQLGVFTEEILVRLFKIGVGPILCAGIVSKPIIELVFGQTWSYVGYAISWMVPWFLMQFMTSPIAMSMHITGNQPKALFLTVFGLLLRNSFVLIAFSLPSKMAFEAYAISGLIFYSVCFVLFCSISNVKISKLMDSLKSTVPFIVIAVLLSLVTRYAFLNLV